MKRFWDKVDKSGGCWEWTGCSTSDGYGQFSMSGKTKYAHRVSWEIGRGDIPSGLFVLHKCDNPGCVNPDHLFLGTQKDNMRDCMTKGRGRGYLPCGESHPRTKLTEEDVRWIRQLGAPQRLLALCFGVGESAISGIVTRRCWKHI